MTKFESCIVCKQQAQKNNVIIVNNNDNDDYSFTTKTASVVRTWWWNYFCLCILHFYERFIIYFSLSNNTQRSLYIKHIQHMITSKGPWKSAVVRKISNPRKNQIKALNCLSFKYFYNLISPIWKLNLGDMSGEPGARHESPCLL